MKLYMSPGSCSLSPHIVLREAGIPCELVRVNLANKTLKDGADYLKVNPKGQVPALELDNGEILTEGAVIVQYLADQVPTHHLLPPCGTMARYRAQEWLNFIATEIHRPFASLFKPQIPETYHQIARGMVKKRMAEINTVLSDGRQYLLGDTFSVADAYLFTTTTWGQYVDINYTGLPYLVALIARIGARPAVQDALDAEAVMR